MQERYKQCRENTKYGVVAQLLAYVNMSALYMCINMYSPIFYVQSLRNLAIKKATTKQEKVAVLRKRDEAIAEQRCKGKQIS